eukprot:2441996-Prymnesium_polylepis.1
MRPRATADPRHNHRHAHSHVSRTPPHIDCKFHLLPQGEPASFTPRAHPHTGLQASLRPATHTSPAPTAPICDAELAAAAAALAPVSAATSPASAATAPLRASPPSPPRYASAPLFSRAHPPPLSSRARTARAVLAHRPPPRHRVASALRWPCDRRHAPAGRVGRAVDRLAARVRARRTSTPPADNAPILMF